ncbi:unnamed protein product [Fraxinus pennsylvanica]|uniref:Malectin-like domain-containing protein n=1 Tax=Fraxinus pennsylvanica TaxID=56036 RepID=A0AAD2DZG3_9LAMI|nr:unnamed protein product [Fraxinus pennsylvanica]
MLATLSTMNIVIWVGVALGILSQGSYSSYTPADNYLLVCGSSQNVTFNDQTYVPDSLQSSVSLKSQGNSFVATSNSTPPSPIYQSARIFTSTTSYKFDIETEGRHWIRLYFYPVPGHNLTSASITVVTENFVLLHNFSFETFNGTYLFKEYAINVTLDNLVLNFIPSNNSIAFVNAIEVVSAPDNLIPDQAVAVSPPGPFTWLSGLALETVYRLNMGGPLVTAQNDTLGRTWENDVKYLHVNSSATNVSVNPLNIKYGPAVSPEIAPNSVYSTAETMGDANVVSVNFNITWVLPVDPNFTYFVRVHFCDIVSKSMNSLVFNLYINTDSAFGGLDLSNLAGNLDVPVYKDFVSNNSAGSDTLSVSVGPDTSSNSLNAIMNGLEIMKISNEARSFVGLSAVETLLEVPPKKNKIGIIIGSVGGAVAALAFIGLCYCCLAARRSRSTPQGNTWLPLPLYGNSLTMTKMSTLSQKSGTASCISLASSNLGRRQQLTEKSDVYSFGVVLLELEETSSALTEPDDNSTNHIPDIPLTSLEPFDNSVSMIEGVNSGTDDDAEDAATSAVFSQLVNPRGR